MSMTQIVLAPLVREYWIGRTYTHGRPAAPDASATGGGVAAQGSLELRPLREEDLVTIRTSDDPDLRRRSARPGPEIRRFVALRNGEPVGVCTFGFGNEYARSGGFYQLEPGSAELTDIFTSSHHRGLGVARTLIRYSAAAMHDEGFRTLYAKVWHSNHASSSAFRAAGWTEHRFFVRICPRGMTRTWHMEWPRR